MIANKGPCDPRSYRKLVNKPDPLMNKNIKNLLSRKSPIRMLILGSDDKLWCLFNLPL